MADVPSLAPGLPLKAEAMKRQVESGSQAAQSDDREARRMTTNIAISPPRMPVSNQN